MTSFSNYDRAASVDVELAELMQAMKLPQGEDDSIHSMGRSTVILTMQELIDTLESMIQKLDKAQLHCKRTAVEQDKKASLSFKEGNFGECFQSDVEKKVNIRMNAIIAAQIDTLASQVKVYKIRLQQIKFTG